MGRNAILGVLLLVIVSFAASANQLSTVGVVDVQQVYNSFYRESRQVRELERLRDEYQEEIDSYLDMLEVLRDDYADARHEGDIRRALELEEEIEELEVFVDELTRRRRRQLERRQQEVLTDDFFEDLQQAIVYVAETEGYTIVLRSDADGLQWWSSVVDISQEVVDRLRRTR